VLNSVDSTERGKKTVAVVDFALCLVFLLSVDSTLGVKTSVLLYIEIRMASQ